MLWSLARLSSSRYTRHSGLWPTDGRAKLLPCPQPKAGILDCHPISVPTLRVILALALRAQLCQCSICSSQSL